MKASKEKKTHKALTRRDFIKTAVGGAACGGLAAGGLFHGPAKAHAADIPEKWDKEAAAVSLCPYEQRRPLW